MRYRAIVEYDGSGFHGWQRQKDSFSVQEAIEKAIKFISKTDTTVFAAGRTDSGVHALGQVIHFDMDVSLDLSTVKRAINYNLKPMPVVIIDISESNVDFHARFSAKERCYVYKIFNRREPDIFNKNRVWQVFPDLNFEIMCVGAELFLGKLNLNAFRSSYCQAYSSVRTINSISLNRKDDNIIEFRVAAKSFLHNQVRIMTGTLVELGLGKLSIERIKRAISDGKRSDAGSTAPAFGLYLERVKY